MKFFLFAILLFVFFKTTSGLFEFLKSKQTPKVLIKKEDFNLQFLGIHPANLAYYTQESGFSCDNNQKHLTLAELNDNYCDCLDGIDEPGTSACSYINHYPSSTSNDAMSIPSESEKKHLFYCENKGYQSKFINTNKINDGYCDCCDGSDELSSSTLCYNTCNEIFKEFKQKNQLKISNFITAYKLYKNFFNTQHNIFINNEKISLLTENEIKNEEKLRQEFEEKLNYVKEKIYNDYLPTIELNKSEYENFLLLNTQDISFLTQYLIQLMRIFDIEEYVLSRYFEYEIVNDSLMHENDLDEEKFHENEPEEMVYNEEMEDDTKKCRALDFISDDDSYNLVKSLCNSTNLLAELKNVISKLIQNKGDFYTVLTLIELYQKKNNIWESNFSDLIKEIKSENIKNNENNHKLCPFVFRGIEFTSCLNEDKLLNLKDNIKFNENHYYLNDEYNQFNNEVNNLSNKINDLKNKKYNSINNFKYFNDENINAIAILSLADQCFNKNDGKFNYNLCILKDITQKENHGRNLVTLGTFDSIKIIKKKIDEDLIDENSSASTPYYYELNYIDGQMCWGHGKRKATVHVFCGKDNNLIEIREPSTCSYYLKFYSPIVCNLDYAQYNFLTELLSENINEL